MELIKLTNFLDEYLNIEEYEDISLNGLQVEASSTVTKIGLATDACMETFQKAASLRCDLLIVHHGLYWGKPFAITGPHAKRIKTLLNSDLSLYAAHLPLDLHHEVGNNAGLIKLLGFEKGNKFGNYHGVDIGYLGNKSDPIEFTDLVSEISSKLKTEPKAYNFGPSKVENIAIISGGAASMLEQVRGTNIDTFFTGESDHVSFHTAKELEVNIIFGGHYATETIGVKLLGDMLCEKFDLESVFIDVPTGM